MVSRRSAPSRVDWYPQDWLQGTAGLNADQLAVYVQIVNLIYAHRGRLPDNDDRNHRSFLISLRRFRAVKAELVAMGKIKIVDGLIYQRRAVEEWRAAEERYENFSDRGSKAANKRWDEERRSAAASEESGGSSGGSSAGSGEDKPLKIVGGKGAIKSTNSLNSNETAHAACIPTGIPIGNTHPTSTILVRDSTSNDESGADVGVRAHAKARAGPRDARASRIPDDWQPCPKAFAFGNKIGFDDDEIWQLADAFRDHWQAEGGERARKCDWLAAFRTWLRRELKFRSSSRNRAGGPHRGSTDQHGAFGSGGRIAVTAAVLHARSRRKDGFH